MIELLHIASNPHTNHQPFFSLQQPMHNSQIPKNNFDGLFCFICQDLISKPHTAICGHTFCYLCLDQYLIFSDICPKCQKPIRGKPLSPVPCISEFIQNIVCRDSKEKSILEQRNLMAKEYIRNREPRGMKVGMILDIRDANHIWCQGMVVRIVTRSEFPVRFLRINYINYLQKKEQEVPMDSDRLASKGFFTHRNDIPHYGSKPTSSIITKYQI